MKSKTLKGLLQKTKFLIVLIIISAHGYAQDPTATATDWVANPSLHKVNKLFEKESAVYLLEKRSVEYVKNEKEGNIDKVKISHHTIIKVNDEKGIEMFNKIYIGLSSSSEMTMIKARTISPSGKVMDLPASKIFDVEEEGNKYKKFALEGVEKGSEIEYMYTKKTDVFFFGIEYFQSSSTPYQHVEFSLSVPEYLYFDVKGYNGFTVSKDTVINEQRIINASEDNIAAVADEKYSEKTPLLKNIQYKLSYNISKGRNVRVFTWNELAKTVYTNYNTVSEKEQKAVNNFVGAMNINSDASEVDKIVAVEEYIKGNINNSEDFTGDEASMLDKIIKTKNASDDGVSRLYIAVFNKLNIPYQIVYPSKRDEAPLDESFENYRRINEIVFKFPSTGKFLSPTDRFMRYPFIHPYWAATRGLYLKGTSIGDFKTAIAVFDTIPMEPFEKNYHNITAAIKMDPSNDTLLLHLKQSIAGYNALPYRPAYVYLQKDKLDEFNKSSIKDLLKSDLISNIKVENTEMGNFYKDKPLVLEADVRNPNLVEHAGNKLLIKMGEVIGPQEQMYQEKPRQLPIVLQYPHSLDRDLTFTIPDGYTVKNLKDLNMNVVHKDGSGETMGFISNYTLVGNQLNIKIHEFYKSVAYPLKDFDQFKNVINASADFNKVILVLEKKA
jgi:hypothetical protein